LKALIFRFYNRTEVEFLDLSPRQVGKLVEHIRYVYEMSEDFGKPPKQIKKGPSDSELLAEADKFGIDLPPKVRYQMGDSNWKGGPGEP